MRKKREDGWPPLPGSGEREPRKPWRPWSATREQTIAYYALDGVARELIRTTSLLERTNRELRRKFRQVCCFGSLKGAEVAIYVQVKRLNARWSKQPWWETARSLSFDCLNLDP